MYCRCTWLLFYSAFASMWVSTSTVLTIGVVQCHGCLGNTCYPSVYLLKVHHYRTIPVPKHIRVVYSQQKLGFGHPWVWTVACFCCMHYFLLSWIKCCNYLWFSHHCVLHFVTGLNERDMSVPINKIIGMLNYNSCWCFDWSVFLLSSHYTLWVCDHFWAFFTIFMLSFITNSYDCIVHLLYDNFLFLITSWG